MPRPGRVPRPKHLFPEIAAAYFGLRRWGLHIERFFRDEAGWYPAWTLGALSGSLGLTLTVLLFLFHDPPKDIAPEQVTPQIPLADLLPEPPADEVTPAKPPVPRPDLELVFDRFRVHSSLDETFRTTTAWSQRVRNPGSSLSIRDIWRMSVASPTSQPVFQPYFLSEHPAAAAATVVTPAQQIDPLRPLPAVRLSGIRVEKLLPGPAELGLSYRYVISVQNTSGEVLPNCEVRERIAQLHRVSLAEPEARVDGNELVWQLNAIPPGGVRELTVTLVPDTPEDLEVVTGLATVATFGAVARVQPAAVPMPVPPTIPEPEILPEFPFTRPLVPAEPDPIVPVTTPEETPPEVLLPSLRLAVSPIGVLQRGETLSLVFQVSNVGNAPAEDVAINVDLSPEFQHRYGKYVLHKIERLEPGATHQAILRAVAKEEGTGVLTAALVVQGNPEELQDIPVPVQPKPKSESESKPAERTGQAEPRRQTCGALAPESQPQFVPEIPQLAYRPTARHRGLNP